MDYGTYKHAAWNGNHQQIVDQISDNNSNFVVLTETRTESCAREIDGQKFMSSGYDLNARPNGGLALLVGADMKIDFNPISNRATTLALHLGEERIGLLFYRLMPKNLQNSVRPL